MQQVPQAWPTAATPPRHLVLHVGFRKVGTTTVQETLRLNGGKFTDRIAIHARDHLTETWRNEVFKYSRSRTRWRLWRIERAIRRTFEGLERYSDRDVIVSDENLIGSRLFQRDGSSIFQWASEIIPLAEKYSSRKMTVVFYRREYSRWIRSCYNQEVVNNRLELDYDEWLRGLPSDLDWESGLRMIMGAIRSPVVVFDLEKQAQQPLPLGHELFDVLGLDSDSLRALDSPSRQNESPTPAMLETILAINRLRLPLREREHRVLTQLLRERSHAKA